MGGVCRYMVGPLGPWRYLLVYQVPIPGSMPLQKVLQNTLPKLHKKSHCYSKIMNSYEEQVNNSFFTVTILNFQSLLNNMLHFQITVFQYYYIGFTKNENQLVISFWQNGC